MAERALASGQGWRLRTHSGERHGVVEPGIFEDMGLAHCMWDINYIVGYRRITGNFIHSH